MNFTPVILTYISAWSIQNSLDVDVRLNFSDNSFGLIFSFSDTKYAKVWNKVYEPEFLRNCNVTLYDLVKETLKEAERYFKEVK